MAFFNPADYEARRRRATQSFGATGAMNAYANFLSQQRGTRE
jgi:aspartate/tyrosine/aromatic aminotransferase